MSKRCIVKQPLAIVGIACRFPGAVGMDQFWELMRNGGCSIAEVPSERLDRSLYYSPDRGKHAEGKTYSTLGGVVPIVPVDATLCSEPDAYDPVHLMMLDVAAQSCRDVGWDPLAVPSRNVGVYVGHARTSHLPAELVFGTHVEDCVSSLRRTPAFDRLPEVLREAIAADLIRKIRGAKPHLRESGKPYFSPSMAATLVSQTLGLTGPHAVIDAACASSLIALALAAGPLQEGRIDAAIVGGASFSNWLSMALFSKAQALSASGSYPFDARADGFISSDGYAAVVVKTLERAVTDGDRVHAVIRGIGISSDGRGKSLWAPRKDGQVEAIRRAYANGIDPSCLQFIEAHGTSTQLGDATELLSLAEVLGPILLPGRRIPVASVKGNIGHTCETAGLAGLIKIVLAMNHGTIPPAVGFERPNPDIDLERLPFFIPTEPLEWPAVMNGVPRRAAVDAFGIGGLNAHVVIDEFTPASKASVAVAGDPKSKGDEVAVIGAGAVFPGAATAEAFWRMIASGDDPKTTVPPERWDAEVYWNPGEPGPWQSSSRTGGFISDFSVDPLRFRIPPRQISASDPLQYMVLDAADQALRDAGYDAKSFDRRRVAVIVGAMFCNDFMRILTVALQYPEFDRELQAILQARNLPEASIRDILAGARSAFHQSNPALQDETGSFSASTLASRVARTLDLMGGAFSLDAEEASSGAALDAAVSLLRSGACDMVLCAGAQRAMDVGIYAEYGLRGLMAAGDQEFIPAEGAGVLLLKSSADARKDGDRIRAVIEEVRASRTATGFSPDRIARQMGHALGASGIASVLAAISPDQTAATTVATSAIRGLRYDIDIGKKAAERRPRIAFLFSGQGSQYTGMLRQLVTESSAAAAKLDEADVVMKRLGYQTFSEIAWEAGSGLGIEPWQTQVSMLLADVIILAALDDVGVRPDVTAGHSYGEFPALVAAGALTLEQAIRATRTRAELVKAATGGRCRLMATSVSLKKAQRIIDDSGAPIFAAIQNSPDQTILGGNESDLEAILPALKAAGCHSTMLPMPGAFHTPLFAEIREPFLEALRSIPVLPPRIPFMSGVSLRYVAEPAEIRENLAVQPSVFFDYTGMVRRLAEDGVTVFIEVGPQQVLTKLTKRILGDAAVALSCDNPQAQGMASLMQVRSLLGQRENEPSAQRHFSARERRKNEIAYFDATLRRKEKNLRRSATPSQDIDPAPDLALPAATDADWSSYLIQFVCEQTGYGREVVDLDVDLEAELGIDSIKKMQLFSELRERFDFGGLQPSALSSFSTLRHVLTFLENSAKERTSDSASHRATDDRKMRILRVQGSPAAMGKEHGRVQAADIQTVVREYGKILGDGATQRPDFRAAVDNLDLYFGEAGLEELQGIAEGAGLPLEIIAGLNLALMPELLPGCTHFAFRDHAGGTGGILHGINEDAPLLATLGQSLLPTALIRHPEGKIPHLTFVLPGQFSGINGINARGISVSSTLLLDRMPQRDIRPGRIHCDLVKEILETATTVESAVDIFRGARRVGGWGVLIGHRDAQDLRYLEYDENAVTLGQPANHIFGANHGLLGPSDGSNERPAHSRDRLNRLEELLNSNGNGDCSLEEAQAALRDCYDSDRKCRAPRRSMHTIRRIDNMMSLIMRPRQHEVWVAPGGETETYQRLDLNELFDPHIMRRWVLRAVEAPLPGDRLDLKGPTLMVGASAVAKAVKTQLDDSAAQGVDWLNTPEDAIALLARARDSELAPRLVLMSCLDEQAPDILSIYQLCRLWVERIQNSHLWAGASLAAAISLGGDFGFSGHVGNMESGGVAGLLKAIRREFPALKVKVVDTLREAHPERLAAEILGELCSEAQETEVGYRFGQRFTVGAYQRSALPRSAVSITRGGAWIVTGGRSGITAYAAQALFERYGIEIHAIGRSSGVDLPYPGVYHRCDVADPAALHQTVEKIRGDSGPIRGILHGAGVEAAARFDRKSMEMVRATIASKVHGASYLMESTRQDPLEAFIAFGSVSGRFGGQGQTDYSLANDMLAKCLQKFRRERPECASVVFHWPAWDEIGMAMREESRSVLEMAGQRFMPPKEGAEHLIAELEAGAPEGEVLILDGPGVVDTEGCMQPAFDTGTQFPLIEGILARSSGHCAADIRFDPGADVFLRDHRYRGVPLLPAAAGVEALVEGSGLWDGSCATVLRDVEIRNGLSFADKTPKTVRVVVDSADGVAECRLVSEFRGRKGNLVDPQRILISGSVKPDSGSRNALRFEKPGRMPVPLEYPNSGPLLHGASFRCLKEFAVDGDKGLGVILAQNPDILGGARRGTWAIPVAELDACLVACGGYVVHKFGSLALPRTFACLRFFRNPAEGERCEVLFRDCGGEQGMALFDFVLRGADGSAILQAEGFGMAILGQGKGR